MEFRDVCRILSSTENIHEGGCGISAIIMYRWIKKHDRKYLEGFSEKPFAIFFDDREEFSYNSEISKNGDRIEDIPHVVLHHKEQHLFFDCRQKSHEIFRWYHPECLFFTENEILSLINSPGWKFWI